MKNSRWLIALGVMACATVVRADPLDDLAAQLAKGATQLTNRKVAVLTFTYPDGGISTGSSLVAEGLTTKLVGRKKINVIERSQLSKIMSEQKLELTGVTLSTGPQKIGQILNVDAVVTGTLADVAGNKTVINARMISSASGEVISAAAAVIDRTWEDAPHQPYDNDPKGDDQQTRYMSPLIPVQQGSYHNYQQPPIPRRRPPVVTIYSN